MSWHNPFIGSNEFRSSENGARASEFETFATAGSGNRARFTYVVAYRDPTRVGGLVQREVDWRCCRHCLSLYYNGFPQNGRCANGGEHDAGGSWDFVLPYGVATSSNLQNDWRSCRHCLSLYYNGFPQNGRCANGGEQHAGGSWDYVLPHGVATSSSLQNDWRSCRHCLSLYYNGFLQNGRCANGGEHDAGGSWDYVLPHV
jgi:hypothetical protein